MHRKNHSSSQNRQSESDFSFTSPNMHYIYYREYFSGLTQGGIQAKEKKKATFEVGGGFRKRNEALYRFRFPLASSPLKEWQAIATYRSITLETMYPGLLIGTGNPHDLNGNDVLKAGFSFDYVTGLPYIPGSSLKGYLRSIFPKHTQEILKTAYIQEILPHLDCQDVQELIPAIFENQDVFLGAFPTADNKGNKEQLLAQEYITPHSDKIKNPVPLSFLKVKPGIQFEFGFLLQDSVLPSGKKVTIEEKLRLFKTILTDIGIGAKTNTGFSQFKE
ncbi:type III-B CRISPR module RAMP protein Cmr6 [Streptococcus sp. zg-86]|uniref:Type III-B CRISPR module RAMP protein Cmr6 n=2 Tax=Streptococcus TaxID=1301 RepID=A0A6I4RIQ7_9STRE|nr:type III-B CRISPR module RAMP protein Cmr6 [Streptococcus sp. zg-86]MTB90889.1 type III-B CRISPR module RAMP protein Cmr6 [Streptococcus sp. zg-36]MWV56687.1 type III-B CRISPR module RAMP protein Cmr6 [Streptococcus sp. zg-70]QTH48732.1 type III-B CRISPR module RAMP protein Cmr6 [Streptococcus sp. zg-86]